MQKIPCTECGALILPATADATGGKCMACKQGIRASIEASRAYYKRPKEYDPYRELWVSLVERSSSDHNLSGWRQEEKRYFAAALLEGEIWNGGFDQYFSNTSARYYSIAIDALQEVEAFKTQEIVKKAATVLFGKRPPPENQEDRWRIMYSKTRKSSELLTRRSRATELGRLDKQFWDDPDGLNDRLVVYAEEHDLVTPFLAGNG